MADVPLAGWIGFLALALAVGLASPAPSQPVCGYQVVHSYPHDPGAFTEGLLYDDGYLYESTGLTGQSTLRRVVLETGAVEQSIDLDAQYFGEGLALFGSHLIQLTYTSGLAFVYDRGTFAQVDQYMYPGDGWGLACDGRRLVMSDGSSTLFFRDPATFAETGRVTVLNDGGPQGLLNELEVVDGQVWANIWLYDLIARIDPVTGEVTSYVDLSGLLGLGTPIGHRADVLNGIAWDAVGQRLFVTGKLWPTLFEIEVVGCVDALVFSDGFEWGTAERWSAGQPLRGCRFPCSGRGRARPDKIGITLRFPQRSGQP